MNDADDNKRAADQYAKWYADQKRRTADALLLLERALPHVPDEMKREIEKWIAVS